MLSDPVAELAIKNEKYIKNCTELYLANRRITVLANFERFVNLEVLWINDNQIERIDGLDQCIRVKEIYAHNNQIRTLDGSIRNFKFLHNLRLSNNKLSDLHAALSTLSKLVHLKELDLFGNPLSEEADYRLHVIAAIPSICVFDRHKITAEERAAAQRLYATRGQRPTKAKKDSKVGTSARTSPLSMTVKLLMRDVRRIEREAKKKEEMEKQALFNLSAEISAADISTTTAPSNKADKMSENEKIVGLDPWEAATLRRHLRAHIGPGKDGLLNESGLHEVMNEMLDQGKKLVIRQDALTEMLNSNQRNQQNCVQVIIEELGDKDKMVSETKFIKACMAGPTASKTDLRSGFLEWTRLSNTEINDRASELFAAASTMQRKALALSDTDSRKSDMLKQAQTMSCKACRLEALSTCEPLRQQEASRKASDHLPFQNDTLSLFSYKVQHRKLSGKEQKHDKETKYNIGGNRYQQYLNTKMARGPTFVTKETYRVG